MLSAGTITDDARGLTWISQDEIVFAPDPIRGLFRISGDGGTPGVLTEPDVAKGERTHRWPAKIIGRNAVLFTVGSMNSPDDYEGARIDALDLDSGQRVTVLQGASMARHTPDGRLVFARGGALHSVAFDAAGLQTSGPVSSVQAGVSTDFTSGAANFAFGLNGTLAYVHSATSDNQRRLYWLDRHDARPALDLPPAVYNDLSFSPDGSKLALVIGPVGSGDVYIHDLERKTMVRLTFDGRSASPIWSPDGRDVYYAHRPLEPRFVSHVMRKPADGSREAERLQTVDSRLYLGYLADPDTLVCFVPDRPGPPMRRSDIVQLRLGSSDPPVPLVATPGQDYGPALSPDRRYLAHVSDSAGRPEIFVRALSGLGAQWQVSLDGGEEPRWSPDGRQLFYRGGSRLMAADVDLRPTFRSSAPRVLFDQVYNLRVESGNSYAVNPKTGRFISIGLSDTDGVTSPPTLRVVLNWFSGR